MFSFKRYFEVFATTMLLLVGLPQFIAPILKWQPVSGTAQAQSMAAVRLSRQVNYSNAGSTDTFQDDRLSYSLTLENHDGMALTGTPLYLDGQSVERVMVASVIPAGTYLSGAPYAPAGWQTIYSTDDRQQTGRGNNDTRVDWTSYRPNNQNIRRIAFVKTDALEAYEIVDGLNFSLSLEDTPIYAPGIRNAVEFYANAQGTPTLLATDESFYTDIDGIEIAQTNQGKPTAEPAPLTALNPTPIDPIDLLEAPVEPLVTPAEPPLLDPIDLIEAPVEPISPPIAIAPEPALPEPVIPEPVIVPEPVSPEPIAQIDEFGGTCTYAPATAQYSVGVVSEMGSTPSSAQVGGLFPLAQVPGKNLTYFNPTGRLDNFSDPGASVVVGHRFYGEEGDRIHGGYLAYDLGNTGDSTFNQIGVGAETLGEVWDGRVNAYIPLEGRQEIDSDNPAELTYEDPLTTVEAEIGAKLHTFDNGGEVRAYGGPYYYTDADTLGGRVGVSAEPINGVTVGASVQSDGIFDTQVGFSLNYQFGGSRSTNQTIMEGHDVVALHDDRSDDNNPCSRLNRITTPIRRTSPVRVRTQTQTQTQTAPPPTLSVSDRTLKKNIAFLGETAVGHKLYAFDYLDNASLPAGRFVGVMAQDLLQDYPEAVVTADDGTYAVHYDSLGLRMATYSEWQQQGIEAVLAK